MRSTLTQRGQTVVPARIRKHFNLSPADRLEWIIEGDCLRVCPVRADPIAAFRGQGKGGATARLLAERRADSQHE
ncbi:AbrB/MazE/SpoVT family DNA-binding domain-containing protein [Sulfuricystis multivorans]|uniref:AbrB/MazE/SpoVT family DNA-binding domain-containing protein n=1 Tax=Sulfuricystis multivorans TaxID=2211108 RepID=UPI000F827996|nr:AbrB/MazE/SpoVT family DNA-binding domain-containing protein [Sulfuricystis multivorans]